MATVAITGHTAGIGKAMAEYFTAKDYQVLGFSRSNGYDISNEHDRYRIVAESKNADVFVNNANDFKTHSPAQTLILKLMTAEWFNESKLIVNVSSTGADFAHNKMTYNINKRNQDEHLKIVNQTTKKLHTINLKPDWVATEWVNASWPDVAKFNINWPDIGKLDIDQVMKVFDFAFTNLDTMRITEISMYPKFNS
jgi:NADP-dependent 3-hydroxy acid dehydrogenase YdfG